MQDMLAKMQAEMSQNKGINNNPAEYCTSSHTHNSTQINYTTITSKWFVL